MLSLSRIVVLLLILHLTNAKRIHEIYKFHEEIETPLTNLIVADGSQIDIPWLKREESSPTYGWPVVHETIDVHAHNWNREIESSSKRDQGFIAGHHGGVDQTEIKYNRMIWYIGFPLGLMVATITVSIAISYRCYNLYKRNKDAETVDYPAYGVTGPSAVGDDPEKNQSSQQMISPVISGDHARDDISDTDEEPDSVSVQPNTAPAGAPRLPYNNAYTVFECAGLAAQMSSQVMVKNPLFPDDTGRGDTPDTNQ